jgi:tetratricopeptide (TPR) repeat protein
MAGERAAQATELLIGEAWSAHQEGRYQAALAAAGRAVEAAQQLDDPVLLIRALRAEATATRQTGNFPAALASYTRILGLAEDSANRGRLDDRRAAEAIGVAHWDWVECARFVTGIPVRELFGVLEAAERWLAATGHLDWRAGVLSQRASVHDSLGEADAAIAAAEEALALKIHHPNAPGYTLSTHRYMLGYMLRAAGRAAESEPHYRAVVADPAARSWDRYVAHEGLAHCALEARDLDAARREARTAVLLAESLSDDALCTSLHVLAEVYRADGDLEGAWQAATRYLASAEHVGGHNRPYYAVRIAVDVALDRSDLTAAERLLGELEGHAAALDASTGTRTMTNETEKRRQRLTDAGKRLP